MFRSSTVLASGPDICLPALTRHRCSLVELLSLALTTQPPDRVFPERNMLVRNSNRPHTASDSGGAQSQTLVLLPNSDHSVPGRFPSRRDLVTNLDRSRPLSNSRDRPLRGLTQALPNPYTEKSNSRLCPHRRDQSDYPFRSL